MNKNEELKAWWGSLAILTLPIIVTGAALWLLGLSSQ